MKNVGMMWIVEKNNLPLSTKIREAVAYYQDKYGAIPTLIIVNPKTTIDEGCNEFAISKSKSIRINHLWLGMEEK